MDDFIPLPFLVLVNEVRKIDEAAANYLMSDEYKNSEAFTGYGKDVNMSVRWAKSPQGRKYWEELYEKMGG